VPRSPGLSHGIRFMGITCDTSLTPAAPFDHDKFILGIPAGLEGPILALVINSSQLLITIVQFLISSEVEGQYAPKKGTWPNYTLFLHFCQDHFFNIWLCIDKYYKIKNLCTTKIDNQKHQEYTYFIFIKGRLWRFQAEWPHWPF